MSSIIKVYSKAQLLLANLPKAEEGGSCYKGRSIPAKGCTNECPVIAHAARSEQLCLKLLAVLEVLLVKD